MPSPSWAPALMSPFSRTASRTLSGPWGPPPRDCVGRGHHSDHLSGQLPHSGLQRPPREADRTRPATQARRHISWGRALGQDGDPTEYQWLCTTVPSLTLPDEENHVCPLWHSVTGWGPDRKLQLGPAKVRWGTLDAVPGTESFSPMTGKGSSGRVPGSQEGSSPISALRPQEGQEAVARGCVSRAPEQGQLPRVCSDSGSVRLRQQQLDRRGPRGTHLSGAALPGRCNSGSPPGSAPGTADAASWPSAPASSACPHNGSWTRRPTGPQAPCCPV